MNNSSDTEAPFQDLHLVISEDFVFFSKIFDIRDDFEFDSITSILRACCPSIFSSVVPRDDFSLAIELTFVTFGHGFIKAGSILFHIDDA